MTDNLDVAIPAKLGRAGGNRVKERAGGNRVRESDRRIMTVGELAKYLRVHPSTIYRLLKRGELPGFRIGTDWRFDRERIERWLASLPQSE